MKKQMYRLIDICSWTDWGDKKTDGKKAMTAMKTDKAEQRP